MKKSLLSILISFFVVSLFAQGQLCQQDLFPKQSTNRYWGYVNIFDQWQILPIFTTAEPFRGKTAVVLRGMKYGAVNCEGKLIVPCQYQEMKNFVGGKSWVKKDGLWGLVNDEGKVLLQPIYKEIKEISKYSDQVWVLLNDTWGVYDFDLEQFIYEPQFHEIQVLDDKTSLVKTAELSGIIRLDTVAFVYPMELEKVFKVAPYRLAVKKNNKWGMLTYHGRLLIEPIYDTLFFKYKNLIQIESNALSGLANYKGKIVTPVRFDSIAQFSEGGARVCKDGLCGFVSVRGKLVLPIDLSCADKFSGGLCIAKRTNGFGLLNPKNEWIVADTFGCISPSVDYSYFVAKSKERTYYINSEGRIQTGEKFIYIDLLGSNNLARVKNEAFYLYDFRQKKYVTSVGFDSISAQNRQVFLYEDKGKIGVLDTAGQIRVPNLYTDIRVENKRLQYFFIELNNKWGLRLIDKELIPIINDSLGFLDKSYLLVKEDGYYGVFTKSGKEVMSSKYDKILPFVEYEQLVWPIIYKQKNKVGMISKSGTVLKLPKHKQLRYLKNGLYGYSFKEKWGVMNRSGQVLIEAKYDEIGHYEQGILIVRENGKWLKVSKQGKKR